MKITTFWNKTPCSVVDRYSRTELLGLFWTLSIVLYVEDKKSHTVSETGSVSVLRWMGQDKPTQLGPLERASLNHWIDCVIETMQKVQNKPNSSVRAGLCLLNYFYYVFVGLSYIHLDHKVVS
jgi:hypothetical protein